MSVHPSLSSKGKGKRHRSVLKRYERLKELRGKEKWQQGNSIFGLPKIKTLHWKLKKAKKAEKAEEVPAGEAAPETAAEQKTPSAKEKKADKK